MPFRRFLTVSLGILTVLVGWPALADDAGYTLISGQRVATLERFQECDVCPEMIALPMGTFTLGAPLEEAAQWEHYVFHNTKCRIVSQARRRGWARAGPVHQVEVDLPRHGTKRSDL